MAQELRIAVAQINTIVGDLEGNTQKILQYIQKAKEVETDIISFPELSVTGYPPEDLLLKPKFIDDNIFYLEKLAKSIGHILTVVGFVDRKKANLYNAAAVIYQKKIERIYHKMLLPNYGIFDEKRYFQAGENPFVFRFGQYILGVNICEDIWHKDGPIKSQAQAGAKLILNINASPYHAGKIKERENIVRQQARLNCLFIVYTNLVGSQDELVFDGQSMVVDSQGKIIKRASAYKEDLLIVDLDMPQSGEKSSKAIIIADEIPERNKMRLSLENAKPLKPLAEIYQALMLGLHDYVNKNGFQKVVIGLSGGIDSSLVTAIAVDALGQENVMGVFMPSRYSSLQSRNDAQELAKNLGIKLLDVSIEPICETYLKALKSHFAGSGVDITEENLQARIRGNILMALSNKFGWLVLSTGNKSEMSVGYATLYGDMAGGFAVIKDVPKTLVYKLARYRNSLSLAIPEHVLIKEPSAELKFNQKDTDNLPVYETLDPILKNYIEEDKELDEIISLGFHREIVAKVLGMVDKSEYKRRQSPPGIKITPKAFGKDRRMPITNKYRG